MRRTRPYDQQVTEDIRLNEILANRHGRAYEATLGDERTEVRIAHQLCEDQMAGAQYPAQARHSAMRHLRVVAGIVNGCSGCRMGGGRPCRCRHY